MVMRRFFGSTIKGSAEPLLPFIFEVVVTAGQTLTLPLSGGIYDFTVDWGDGNESSVNAQNDPNRNHTYINGGTYEVSITGICTVFTFRNVTASRSLIRRVITFGEIQFVSIDFQQCNNLTEISGDLKFSGTQLVNFIRQTAITTIPSGLLENAPNLTFIQTLAFATTTLTTIPTDLFDTVSSQITQFDQVFSGCTNLAVNVSSLVSGMDFTSCISTNRMFNSCPNITGNGQDLIDKPKNAGFVVSTASSSGSYRTFFGCTSLNDFATIPAEWK